MKLRDLLFGRPKAEAPAIWKRKKCKSCVKYFRPDCPNYISRDGILKWFKRPLDPACKDWKGKK